MKHPNVRVIGLFVVGAVALVIVGLAAFGSTSYFEHRPRAVTFFHGSVAGLLTGAPVTFRGVRIGSVADIAVKINPQTGAAEIPVIMEFDPEKVTIDGGADSDFTKRMRDNGLGASLVMQSVVTGLLAVELDYHPASERFTTEIDLRMPESPEIRGGINAMKDTISKLPYQELADDLLSTLRSIKDLIQGPELRDILHYVAETAKETATIAAVVRAQADGLAKDIHGTTDTARRATERLDSLLTELQPRLVTGLAALDHLLLTTEQRSGVLTGDVHEAVSDVRSLVAPRSALVQDIQTLLRNLAAASGSMRSFAEQLDRNPNALVLGRSHR